MPDDKNTIQIARWYNGRLNENHYQHLITEVASVTDLDLRRSDTRIGKAYHDIDSKLEQIGYHVYTIQGRMDLSRELMPALLLDLERDLRAHPDGYQHSASGSELRVEFYDYVSNSHMESLLIQTKALLDSTAQFYSLTFDRSIRTFSASGKKFVNDINGLSTKLKGYVVRLHELLESEKSAWIDRLIEYRDLVVHFGRLNGMHGSMLKLDERVRYTIEDVSPARMPNGAPVNEYAGFLLHSAHGFEKQMMQILFERLREVHGRPKQIK